MALTDEEQRARHEALSEAANESVAKAKGSQDAEEQQFFRGVAVGLAAGLEALKGGTDNG